MGNGDFSEDKERVVMPSEAENDNSENRGPVKEDNEAKRHLVEKVEFPALEDKASEEPFGIDAFRGVKMKISGELGQTSVRVRDLISLKEGSMLKLDSLADENITLLMNEAPFAHGEVVVINDRYGVRITSFTSEDPEEGN